MSIARERSTAVVVVSSRKWGRTRLQIFTDGLVMCCDVDYGSEGVTQSGRFLAFMALHQEFIFYQLMTGTAIATTKNGKIDFDAQGKIDTEDKKEQLAIIDKLNEQGANIVSYTLLQGIDEFSSVLSEM